MSKLTAHLTAVSQTMTRWLSVSRLRRSGSPTLDESTHPSAESPAIADFQSIADRPANAALQAPAAVMPFYAELLTRTRTEWQFGEWNRLAELDYLEIRHHPEREKLALLAAAGHQQLGDVPKTLEWVRHAQEWGASKALISKMLISGVQASLGRAWAAKGDETRSLRHFGDAMSLVQPGSAQPFVVEARAARESTRLGLLPQAAKLMDSQLGRLKGSPSLRDAQVKILETEIGLLHHELSLAQQRQQLYASPGPLARQPAFGTDEWKELLKQKSVSQLGQDLWVLEKTNYKRGGFFVEFGATDGVVLSNTWLLEKEFGWNGICAEPNPKFFEKLKENRACRLSDQCISGETGKTVNFIFADAFGGSQEYADSDMHQEKRAAYLMTNQSALLPTISLHDFLVQHGAPKTIDYLSIDTEGSEFEILESFPLDKWNIRFLTVEHNFTERRSDIRQILERAGYRVREEKWDDWYEKIL